MHQTFCVNASCSSPIESLPPAFAAPVLLSALKVDRLEVALDRLRREKDRSESRNDEARHLSEASTSARGNTAHQTENKRNLIAVSMNRGGRLAFFPVNYNKLPQLQLDAAVKELEQTVLDSNGGAQSGGDSSWGAPLAATDR